MRAQIHCLSMGIRLFRSEAFDQVCRKGLVCKLQELDILEAFSNYVKATLMFNGKGHC